MGNKNSKIGVSLFDSRFLPLVSVKPSSIRISYNENTPIPESISFDSKNSATYNLPEVVSKPLDNPWIAPLSAQDIKDKEKLTRNINEAQNTAGQIGYNLIDTAMGITNPLWGIASGIAHGGLATKDIANNGLNWSNGLNAGLGLGLTMLHLPKVLNFGTKAKFNLFADASTGTSLSTPLTTELINNAFNEAKAWHFNRINSKGYFTRALKAGFSKEEIPQLLELLGTLLKRLKLAETNLADKSIVNLPGSIDSANAYYWRSLDDNKNLLLGVWLQNPNISYNEAVSKFIHELGHGMTFGLNGGETTGLSGALAKQFPLIERAVKYNKTLYPGISPSLFQKLLPILGKDKILYYSKPTEMLSRGYEFMKSYKDIWNKFLKDLPENSFTNLDVINEAAKLNINSTIFRSLAGTSGTYNFLKNALSLGTPIMIGKELFNFNRE